MKKEKWKKKSNLMIPMWLLTTSGLVFNNLKIQIILLDFLARITSGTPELQPNSFLSPYFLFLCCVGIITAFIYSPHKVLVLKFLRLQYRAWLLKTDV